MGARNSAPYDGLSPDRILDALDSVGIRGDGDDNDPNDRAGYQGYGP